VGWREDLDAVQGVEWACEAERVEARSHEVDTSSRQDQMGWEAATAPVLGGPVGVGAADAGVFRSPRAVASRLLLTVGRLAGGRRCSRLRLGVWSVVRRAAVISGSTFGSAVP
jgi:hypothetical protein